MADFIANLLQVVWGERQAKRSAAPRQCFRASENRDDAEADSGFRCPVKVPVGWMNDHELPKQRVSPAFDQYRKSFVFSDHDLEYGLLPIFADLAGADHARHQALMFA